MNHAPGEVPELSLFRDEDELAQFVAIALSAYTAINSVFDIADLAVGNARGASSLARLAAKMLVYYADQLPELVKVDAAMLAMIDHDLEAIWPIFQGVVDDHLIIMRRMAEELWAVEQGTVN